MGVFSGPSIVNTGLLLQVDAANLRSYPGSGATWSDIASLGSSFSLVNSSYYSYNADNKGYIYFSRTLPTDTEIGGYATRTTSGALSALTYLQNNHSTEVWFNIKNAAATNYDVTEATSALIVFTGFHSGFTYTASRIGYDIWGSNGSGGYSNNTFGITAPAINTWNQVIAIRNGSSLSLYLNGVLRFTGTITTDSTITPSSNTLRIAVGNDSPIVYSFHADVNVSLVRMYNIALSATEVQQNFNATRSRYAL
jgi:phage-related tail fiber protein